MADNTKRTPLGDFFEAVGGLFASSAHTPHSATQRQPGLGKKSDTIAVSCAAPATLTEHWAVIKSQGFTAAQFMEFLQPLADLEGISVSYIYEDDLGQARVYNHKRADTSFENPLSRAIRNKQLTKERALQFALDAEGRTWIESNFIELH